ncbi:MAG: nucleotidyltransferase family protein [Alphaproteobacteria bacterium]|nr:nucleotidyltransferase family protein [Alphaproteobacteria bacterium]
MSLLPRSAMVLAAGLGTRLRPVTETVPKPLIEIGGRTLIDRAIDHLAVAGVQCVVVNIHYKAAILRAHLARRTHPRILLSKEDELLDTGGGVARALPLLEDVFFVVNSDVIWRDSAEPALIRLADAFELAGTDAVLLLHPTATAVGYEGGGDYHLDALGRPRRRREGDAAPYLFAGIQLLHRRLFAHSPGRIFSLVRLFDRAETSGRLRAIVHDGEWFHVGTPQGLTATRERVIRS